MNKETFNFNKWNTIIGWLAFGINNLLNRWANDEFWDCGEYIATAAKLEVGHPPDLFQMIGAFFAMFASDNQHIALMVNMTSVFQVHSVLFCFGRLPWFWKASFKFQPLVLMLTR
jgi:hypothetical protein